MRQALKPFVKWAGGKRQLLAEIRSHLPRDIMERVYYEPFAGAGALFFDLQPPKAVINDSNTDLILTYRVVRDHAEELIKALKTHQEQHNKEYYYHTRSLDREEGYKTLEDYRKAARLIYLNKTCYNGLYRVNSRGFFNVPFGRNKNPLICEEDLLRAVNKYLLSAEITILNRDFEETVSGAGRDSFVYFDPPYHSLNKTGFSSYQADGFGEEDQIRLRNVFLSLADRGIPALLSNADTPFIRELYRHRAFSILSVTARRAINSDTHRRGRVNEVLVKNWDEGSS